MSDREMLDQLVENGREVEFRDGTQMVPAYLADMMVGIPTFSMTKEEAIAAANHKLEQHHIATAYDGLIKQHFGGPR